MKKYAVAIDVSPSEQIGDDDEQIMSLGALFGLETKESFDLVGDKFPERENRMRLRKFAGSSERYRTDLLAHLCAIRQSGHVVCGISVVNQRFIRRVGLPVWTIANGEIPAPSSFNKKGKPRVELGGYLVDGKIKPAYEVLIDDLAIIGWLALEIGMVHRMLCDISHSLVNLDVIIDKLPNDQGAEGSNKSELLKGTLAKLADNTVAVVGHPDVSDFYQRDLLVDNLAGLGRELFTSPLIQNPKAELERVVGISKVHLPTIG